MGKMLAFLTILRNYINIKIIQIFTLGPHSLTALQWSLSSLNSVFSFARSRHLWCFGTLPCWSVESWKTSRVQSHGLVLSLSHLLYTQYFHSSPNITAASLIIFWLSHPRRVTVLALVSPPTMPPRAPVLHLSCSPTSSVMTRSGFSICGWLFRDLPSTDSPGQMMAWLTQLSQCDFSQCLCSEPLWKN